MIVMINLRQQNAISTIIIMLSTTFYGPDLDKKMMLNISNNTIYNNINLKQMFILSHRVLN